MFRDDLKVTMATSGLYEWLDKVLRENGVFGEQAESGAAAEVQSASHRSKKKGDSDDKQLMGEYPILWFPLILVLICAYSE